MKNINSLSRHFSSDQQLSTAGGNVLPMGESILALQSNPVDEIIQGRDQSQQLQKLWNPLYVVPPGPSIHQLFEAQVEETPHKIAVHFAGEPAMEISYLELNERANQLAHFLHSLNVGPGRIVGLHLDRSVDMMVALLGTLKVGAAYLPLDPSLPQGRLEYILADAQPSVILSHTTLSPWLPQETLTKFTNQIVHLDTAQSALVTYDKTNVASDFTADALAYILYTSGSTGNPKGVEIQNLAVVNFLNTIGDKPGMTSNDVMLALTTLSFDIAVLELFLPLAVGASLVLAPTAAARNAELLQVLLQETDVTIMQATPATWRMLLAAGWAGKANLKMLCGGEAMPVSLAKRLSTRGGELWNLYGPTETTVWSAIYNVFSSDSEQKPQVEAIASATVPIGHPIANTQLYIVDQDLQLVSNGEAGELLIGGAGLARGYHNRPDLTAERFINNPFGEGRVYRTGDLVRYRSTSNHEAQSEQLALEFLGRLDHQVKIRGFRIELGEIEAVLTEHPLVHAAAVTTYTQADGDPRLVAYLVPKGEQTTEPSGVWAHFLKQRLPAYMVPNLYVVLDTFPLTPSGKINRRALPEPDLSSLSANTTYVAPRNQLEERLVQLWQTHLGMESIGVHDNFFALGGHSLRAVEIVASAKAMNIDISLQYLFDHPTIADLATAIDGVATPKATRHDTVQNTPNSLLVPIQPHGSKPPLFLVHPILGVTYPYVQLAHLLGKDQPVYALRALGIEDGEDPDSSIKAMASRYIDEIRTVQPEGPYQLGGWSFGGWVAHEMAHQLTASGDKVELLALLDTLFRNQTERFYEKLYRRFAFSRLVMSEIWPFVRNYRHVLAEITKSSNGSKSGLFSFWNESTLGRTLRVYFANVQALWSYSPKSYPGRISLFRATEQFYDQGGDMGWGRLNAPKINVVEGPGNHMTILQKPNVGVLASLLQKQLVTTG